jgi:hypothetical protein
VRRSFVLPAALFAAVWLCYVPGNMGCSDSMWSIPTAVSLLDHGDANLDEYLPVLKARGFVLTQRIGDHYYTIYPLGASIMAMPGVLALRPVAAAVTRFAPTLWTALANTQSRRGCGPVVGEPIVTLHSWTEHLIASAFVAGTTVIIYLIAVGETSVFGAVAVALIFAFGTSAWSTASRALWQHGPSMFLLSLALLILLRGGRLFWVGLLLAGAYVVRPTNLIPLVGAAGWVLGSRPRRLPEFLLGVASVFALFVLSNLSIYGSWLSPYYRPGFYSSNAFIAEALAGDLISPNRGLFVYSPVLLLSLMGFALKVASRRQTLLDLSLAACIIGHWIAIAAANGNWWAGHSYGPRFFTDLLPYLIYFIIPVVAWLDSASGVRRLAVAALLGVTALTSVAMHAQGALNPETSAWNGYPVNIDLEPVRVWDWRRPQFLAGITFTPQPRPPVDFDAIRCAGPPAAPALPTIVSNSGGTVVLRWPPAPGSVAVYIVEVGYRPGTNDLPTREVRDVLEPSLTAQRVRPGTYYVRVHGKNRCGDGPASPELAVTVR